MTDCTATVDMFDERTMPFTLPVATRTQSNLSHICFRPLMFAQLVWLITKKWDVVVDITYLNWILSEMLRRHFDPKELERHSDFVAEWFMQLNQDDMVKNILRDIRIANGLNPNRSLSREEQTFVYKSQTIANPLLAAANPRFRLTSSQNRLRRIPVCFTDKHESQIESEGTGEMTVIVADNFWGRTQRSIIDYVLFIYHHKLFRILLVAICIAEVLFFTYVYTKPKRSTPLVLSRATPRREGTIVARIRLGPIMI